MSRRFAIAGPLPTGMTVLEASAGTGKTYTIAGLVTRYVAEGRPLSSLLVVTFTRAAAAELRDRIRTRLVAASHHLDRVLEGGADATDDEALRHLGAGTPEALRGRLRHLHAAVTDFDAATITTIHGFCQQALASLGVAGDTDRAPVFLEDQRDLVEGVVDDVFVRAFHRDGPALSRNVLAEIARAVIGNPGALLLPQADALPDGKDVDAAQVARRVALAAAVRADLEGRKRAAGLIAYDDLLLRLEATLAHPVQGELARRRLRDKHQVALIDEFQDTDPVQWSILSDVFGAEGTALVLIGDPKQAIYSFRGADVHAYLQAARQAAALAPDARQSLDVNWRSDGPLIDAVNLLLDGAALGHPEIAYQQVGPAPPNGAGRLAGAPVAAPLRVRIVRRDSGVRVNGDPEKGWIVAGVARDHVARDVAFDIVALLDSGARIRRPVAERHRRPEVAPPDIAVLVRANAEATRVQRTLLEVGVPAVINGVGSVFATLAATDWLRLLEALERPSDRARVRTAALTAFLGWSCDRLAAAAEPDWEAVHDVLHRWSGILRDRGVAALARRVTVEQDLPARLLARTGGERVLTDLEHIGELLHRAAVTEELGTSALGAWLSARMAESDDDLSSEERARRLESDADAVQVLTVHGAKGLEYPIVYAPFLWSSQTRKPAVPVCHDEARGQRVVDVAGEGVEFSDHQSDALAESLGEDLRLLYVAFTRARHQVVAWWAPGMNSKTSALGRVLYCRGNRGPKTAASLSSLPTDDSAFERLRPLAEASNATISVEASPRHATLPSWSGRAQAEEGLEAARFERDVDRWWRRTSYSGITKLAHELQHTGAPGSEPDEPARDDEPPDAAVGGAPRAGVVDGEETALRATTLRLAEMAGGTDVGTFVHLVLEHADFAAADLHAEVAAHVAEQGRRRAVRLGLDDATVANGLVRALMTPLGPLAGEVRLADVTRADRLDELAFELPLGGGVAGGFDGDGARLDVAAIAGVLRDHVAADDPLAGYADRLADPALHRTLRGFLAGSIDAVLRLRDGAADRFAVVDYKTNRLAVPGEPLTAWHYRPEALAGAMMRAHYPLQALLYAVALHRYLRWRLRGYDPEQNLGPVLYVFVRGMTGPDTPRVGAHPCGVFAWQPAAELVGDLSDLLDRGPAR